MHRNEEGRGQVEHHRAFRYLNSLSIRRVVDLNDLSIEERGAAHSLSLLSGPGRAANRSPFRPEVERKNPHF